MNSRLIIIPLFCVGVLPFMLNGFYNPALAKNPSLYWAVELISWLIIPGAAFIIGLKMKLFDFPVLGFGLIVNEKFGRGKNSILLLLSIIIISPALYFIYTGADLLSEALFPVNYLYVDFDYKSVMPKSGGLRIIAAFYMSATAGVVEEFYYRAMFWRIVEKYRYNFAIYIVLSSLIFSSAHWEGGARNLFSAFIFGAVSSSIYYRMRNVWPLVAGHFLTDYILFIR